MDASRRSFLRTAAGTTAALAVASLYDDWNRHLRAADDVAAGRGAGELAGEESFWFQIQQAFDIDRSLINLNDGGVAPSPRIVHKAMIRQLDFANHAPSHGIGADRKEARLRHLRDSPAERLARIDRIRINTNLHPDHSCGIGNMSIEGIDPGDLARHLWTSARSSSSRSSTRTSTAFGSRPTSIRQDARSGSSARRSKGWLAVASAQQPKPERGPCQRAGGGSGATTTLRVPLS